MAGDRAPRLLFPATIPGAWDASPAPLPVFPPPVFSSRFFNDFFVNPDLIRQDPGPGITHEVNVAHPVDQVFQVPFYEIGEPFMPPAKDKDVKPLEDQADGSKDSVDPCSDPDSNPVKYPDQEFPPAGVMFIGKELAGLCFRHSCTFTGEGVARY